jgi:hypothetical protein
MKRTSILVLAAFFASLGTMVVGQQNPPPNDKECTDYATACAERDCTFGLQSQCTTDGNPPQTFNWNSDQRPLPIDLGSCNAGTGYCNPDSKYYCQTWKHWLVQPPPIDDCTIYNLKCVDASERKGCR